MPVLVLVVFVFVLVLVLVLVCVCVCVFVFVFVVVFVVVVLLLLLLFAFVFVFVSICVCWLCGMHAFACACVERFRAGAFLSQPPFVSSVTTAGAHTAQLRGALTIRIAFKGVLHYSYNEGPQRLRAPTLSCVAVLSVLLVVLLM